MLLDKNLVESYLDKKVLELCRQEITRGRKLGIAVSGGADSVFVLLAFVDIFQARNLQVFHFNHKLRANADIEEIFVKDLCSNLGVACESSSPKEEIQKHSEEAFREARMSFIKEASLRANIKVVAQGHHIGDVAETMLMRLMRGASLEGLVAPRYISNLEGLTFVRPFLAIKKSQIMQALEGVNQGWKDDESNFENAYLRNKIRNKVLPMLRELCDRDLDEMLLLSKTLLQEHYDFFESSKAHAYKLALIDENSIKLQGCARALLRGLVNKFLYNKNIVLAIKTINDLLDKIEQGEPFKLSTKEGFVIFEETILRYEEKLEDFPDFCVSLHLGENILPDNSILKLEKLYLGENAIEEVIKNSNVENCVYMDYASLKMPLYARNRRAGDSIEYMGLKKAKKVQDIFVDKKVARQLRSRIAIVCDAEHSLLWLAYAPPSKKVLVKQKTDVIRLTYQLKYKE